MSLRPVRDDDLPFLRALYASTREEELAAVPWDAGAKRAFLDMQFAAQGRHYAEHFPRASFLVVEQHRRPIGRLYVDRRADEIRLVDIALLPGHRRRGIGGALLRRLLDEAREAGIPVRIHVERFNPAMRLYERLGFERLEDRGVYWLMEWRPRPSPAPARVAAVS